MFSVVSCQCRLHIKYIRDITKTQICSWKEILSFSVFKLLLQIKVCGLRYRETPGKTKRQDLPSELNTHTHKMLAVYVEKHQSDDLYIEYEYFRKVFTESFNISFDSPRSDNCSTCCCLWNKIPLEKGKEKRYSQISIEGTQDLSRCVLQ